MKSLQLLRNNSGTFNPLKKPSSSPRTSSSIALSRCNVRRSLSESDMSLVRSELKTTGKVFGSSMSFSVPKIPEECCGMRDEEYLTLSSSGGSGMNKYGGGGNNNTSNGGSYNCSGDRHGFYEKMGDYYREMIEMDPMNPLLLGNYAKFLHEVELDFVKAEEYYGRAILASPEDGEVLSLYGKLIWETQRDQNRANTYFQQALQASPNDCMVMGTYAKFLWEAEDDDDDDDDQEEIQEKKTGDKNIINHVSDNAVMLEVF